MSVAEDFNRLYSDVSENIARALADIGELKVENKEGQQQLGKMTLELQRIQQSFSQELAFLEEHAEWDRFTLAFFGETNAGKSTLIESMRILFKEQSRQQLLEQNEHDLARFEQALGAELEQLRADLGRVYTEHAAQVSSLQTDARALRKILEDESSARLQLVRDEVSARVTRKLVLAAAGGLLLGAGVMALVGQLAGG